MYLHLDKLKFLFNFYLVVGLFSCAQKLTREIASVVPRSENYLVEMAEYGVMVVVNPPIFRDVIVKTYGNCRAEFSPEWPEKTIEYLKGINRIANGFSRFHLVEVDRADGNEDQDVKIYEKNGGEQVLRIAYRKIQRIKQTDSRIDLDGMECGEIGNGGKLSTIQYEWPSMQRVLEVVENAGSRNSIAAWSFDRSYLKYLAEKNVMAIVDDETLGNIDKNTGWILQAGLNRWGLEIHSKFSDPTFMGPFEQWLELISRKSRFGEKIRLIKFGINQQRSNLGIRTVSMIKNFEKRPSNIDDPIYFYMTLDKNFSANDMPTLKEFNQCLNKYYFEINEYLNGGKNSVFRLDPTNFLTPGFHCRS